MTFKAMDKGLQGQALEELSSETGAVTCDSVIIPENRSRGVDRKTVDALKETFRQSGKLMHPIGVRRIPGQRPILIDGLQRLTAWLELFEEGRALRDKTGCESGMARWHQIPCITYDGEKLSDDGAEYLELTENLDRKALTKEERISMEATRMQLGGRWGNGQAQKKAAKGAGDSKVSKSSPEQKLTSRVWFDDWCELTKTARATGQRLWDKARKAGIVTSTIGKATPAEQDAWVDWQAAATNKGAQDEQAKQASFRVLTDAWADCLAKGWTSTELKAAL